MFLQRSVTRLNWLFGVWTMWALGVTHHAAARPWGSGSPETGGPAEGRGPSSRAATGPQCAPDAPCGLPPATNTNTWHNISWWASNIAAQWLVSFNSYSEDFTLVEQRLTFLTFLAWERRPGGSHATRLDLCGRVICQTVRAERLVNKVTPWWISCLFLTRGRPYRVEFITGVCFVLSWNF